MFSCLVFFICFGVSDLLELCLFFFQNFISNVFRARFLFLGSTLLYIHTHPHIYFWELQVQFSVVGHSAAPLGVKLQLHVSLMVNSAPHFRFWAVLFVYLVHPHSQLSQGPVTCNCHSYFENLCQFALCLLYSKCMLGCEFHDCICIHRSVLWRLHYHSRSHSLLFSIITMPFSPQQL